MKMNRVFSCIALLSLGFVAATPAQNRPASPPPSRPAQSSAKSPAQASSMNGDWVNVDAKTRNLVRITIQGVSVHPYGACSPTPCDWGVLTAKSTTTISGTASQTALVAVHTTKAEQNTITMTLGPDGRLSANVATHFTDKSGRKDYSVMNTMARSAAK